MDPVSIQTQMLIFYCSPVQGRMAGARTNVYKLNSVIRGQPVYKNVRTLPTDKIHKCIMQEDNECDIYDVNNRL